MMGRRKIYAFVMVAIYVVATVLSSMSLLLCEHHRHHHHRVEVCSCHHAECSHHGVVIDNDCCNHHHPKLGDNHTDYIASSQRSDSRASQAMALMLAPIVVDVVSGEISEPLTAISSLGYGDEEVSLRTAYILPAGLRAPPVLA